MRTAEGSGHRASDRQGLRIQGYRGNRVGRWWCIVGKFTDESKKKETGKAYVGRKITASGMCCEYGQICLRTPHDALTLRSWYSWLIDSEWRSHGCHYGQGVCELRGWLWQELMPIQVQLWSISLCLLVYHVMALVPWCLP